MSPANDGATWRPPLIASQLKALHDEIQVLNDVFSCGIPGLNVRLCEVQVLIFGRNFGSYFPELAVMGIELLSLFDALPAHHTPNKVNERLDFNDQTPLDCDRCPSSTTVLTHISLFLFDFEKLNLMIRMNTSQDQRRLTFMTKPRFHFT